MENKIETFDDKKWFLNGQWLKLETPITEEERDYFIMKLQNKFRSNESIKKLFTKRQKYLGWLNALQALEKIGASAIHCILGECDCPKQLKIPPKV